MLFDHIHKFTIKIIFDLNEFQKAHQNIDILSLNTGMVVISFELALNG